MARVPKPDEGMWIYHAHRVKSLHGCSAEHALCACVLGSARLASVHVHSVQLWRDQRLCVCTTSLEPWGIIKQTWYGLLNTCREQWGSVGDAKYSHQDLLPWRWQAFKLIQGFEGPSCFAWELEI